MNRLLTACFIITGILSLGTSYGFAQDEVDVAPKEEEASASAEERFAAMAVLAKRTTVFVLKDGQEVEATLREEALIKYGDETRKIKESTLWVWTYDNEPVFFQKIEVNVFNGTSTPFWTFCFSSATEDALRVHWPFYRETFVTAPKTFTVLEGISVNANVDSVLQLQLRSLMREVNVLEIAGGHEHELRLLPQPLMQFSSGNGDVKGAVFSYALGTNPDAIYVMRATKKDGGKTILDSTVSHMTSAAVVAKFRETEVHNYPETGGGLHDTWGFFFASASASDE